MIMTHDYVLKDFMHLYKCIDSYYLFMQLMKALGSSILSLSNYCLQWKCCCWFYYIYMLWAFVFNDFSGFYFCSSFSLLQWPHLNNLILIKCLVWFCLMHVLTCLIHHEEQRKSSFCFPLYGSTQCLLKRFCNHLKCECMGVKRHFQGKITSEELWLFSKYHWAFLFTPFIHLREITSTRMLRNVVEPGTVFFCQSQCSRWAHWRWDGTNLSSSRMHQGVKCARMLHTVHFAPRVRFTFMSLSVSVMHLFLFRETK